MSVMMSSDYVLEVSSLYYTGHVEPGSWLKQLTGTTRSGMILRDCSLEVSSSNMMAILGSKGSGKKALLDVIACRANGSRKGYVLLNGVNVNRRLFQTSGGYVTGQSDKYLMDTLTVKQTLTYEAKLTLIKTKMRVRQIMSDTALTQLANVTVDSLSPSEKRRLSIALSFVKDPVLLLADEPAWGLDPLNTYFVISILSNFTKKYGRIVLLTQEQPRSDIFPFLDRVTYLCLGDVVYSGNTRNMLDYFRNVGFPCPEIENPLNYFLCLATVDRRSHEKFIESSNQIGLLVDKFKLEGTAFRKGQLVTERSMTPLHALGRPSVLNRFWTLIMRTYSSTFVFSLAGLSSVFFHLFFMPFLFFIVWVFFFGAQKSSQDSYVTKNGLVVSILQVTYLTAIWTTLHTFEVYRRRYYSENRDGLYNGPTFVLAHTIATFPFIMFTTFLSGRIIYQSISEPLEELDWLYISSVIAAIAVAAQQSTIFFQKFVKSKTRNLTILMTLTSLSIVLSSGTLKTLKNLPEYLKYLTYINQPRYAGQVLQLLFFEKVGNAKSDFSPCTVREFGRGCRYLNGTHYLSERFDAIDFTFEYSLLFAAAAVVFFINLLVYSLPTCQLIKAKFRD